MRVVCFVGLETSSIKYSKGHTKWTYRQLKKLGDYFEQNISPLIKQLVNFKATITEMYPPIPWELIADPEGKAYHFLGTTGTEATQT